MSAEVAVGLQAMADESLTRDERDGEMVEAFEAGVSVREIAASARLSTERVRQILHSTLGTKATRRLMNGRTVEANKRPRNAAGCFVATGEEKR